MQYDMQLFLSYLYCLILYTLQNKNHGIFLHIAIIKENKGFVHKGNHPLHVMMRFFLLQS